MKFSIGRILLPPSGFHRMVRVAESYRLQARSRQIVEPVARTPDRHEMAMFVRDNRYRVSPIYLGVVR